VYLTFRE